MKGFLKLLTICYIVVATSFSVRANPVSEMKFADLANHPAAASIENMIGQGVMRGVAPGKFDPNAPISRGDFARSLQVLFRLPEPRGDFAIGASRFADVRPSDPRYAAIAAVAGYMHFQLLCFGCALSLDFFPNAPITRAQAAVALASILAEQHKVTVLNAAQAGAVLANVPDARELPVPARSLIATAIKNHLITLRPHNMFRPAVTRTRAEAAVNFESIQRRFNLPVRIQR